MTPAEALLRAHEKAALLAPTMGRQQSEFLGPMVERELDLLSQMGELPPMPKAPLNAGGIVDVEYTSPLNPYFTTEGPGGGPRGINPFYHGRGIFAYDATKHGQTKIAPSDFTIGSRLVMGGKLREALVGDMAGLAVFSRALSDEEMKTLHAAAHR